MPFCPRCGKEVSEEDSFCPYCREPLKRQRVIYRRGVEEKDEKGEKNEKHEKEEKGEKGEKHEGDLIGALMGGLILV